MLELRVGGYIAGFLMHISIEKILKSLLIRRHITVSKRATLVGLRGFFPKSA